MGCMKGIIKTICISAKKGTGKTRVKSARAIENYGLQNDAHTGPGKRQLSMLTADNLKGLQKKGINVKPGDMGENILIDKLDIATIKLNGRIIFGNDIICRVTQFGKECHSRCSIWEKLSECSMSERGIFMKVLKGGMLKTGDPVELADD